MLKEIKNKINEKMLKGYIANYQSKIPKIYNQAKMLDFILDEDIDHYISISNRSDGKTYNYINFFIKFAIDYDVKFILLSRNFTVRNSYCEIVNNIMQTDYELKYELLEFNTTQFYRSIVYNKKVIGIITDLNEATNLKYFSQYIKNFDILIYDEFLAIESDYLSDEWNRLKTIYSSVNRDFTDEKIIKYPKIIYLGNAVNFSSPILANLDIYNILENHELNSCKQYGNICLEINKNENINSKRNLRAFKEKNDNLTNANFKTNQFNIATNKDYTDIKKDYEFIVIKLNSGNYLKIEYNTITYKCILSISIFEKEYHFNTEISDNNKSSIYLKDKYYRDSFSKKYINNEFLFKNEYSKNFILNDMRLTTLNIYKLFKYVNHSIDEKIKENDKDYILRILVNKIFN